MIHHVFANRSNTGDWMSARGIQALLRPLRVEEHLCDGPFVEETLERLSRLSARDLVVIGGGGLLMDYFEPFWRGFDAIADRAPFCIWGVGYCDLKGEVTHPPLDLIERVVRRSRLCVVRDELSRRHLRRCELPAPVPCPSLVAVDPAPPGFGLLHVNNYTTVGAEAYEFMRAHGQAFAASTGRVYRETNNRIEADSERGRAANLALYAMSDLVISSALHGCVFAVATGRPVLAVSGDRKLEAFMEAAGLGDWLLDARDVGLLPGRLRELGSQRPTGDFVARARRENAAVAARVLAVARGEP